MGKESSTNDMILKIFESWSNTCNPMNSTMKLLEWIEQRNTEIQVKVQKTGLESGDYWYYDQDEKGIINKNHFFFSIKGIRKTDGKHVQEQPIIIQDEIGYLGIIGKIFDGILYFLMQAKIEPGNINKIQISPTIQATKSNFMQVHGGKSPAYLEYFTNKKNYHIVVDQIQSEQSSRFLGKRNRNMVIIIDDDIEVLDTHRWMTLGQIKELMKYDSLVNMDTRTVISCIPISLRNYCQQELKQLKDIFRDESMYQSMFYGEGGNTINKIYQYINDYKMLDKSMTEIVDLYKLNNWVMKNNEFVGTEVGFKVVFCNIEIEGREVRKWKQPLLESTEMLILGLICKINEGRKEFLIRAVSEIGCFDKIEIGPSIQSGILGKNREKNMVEEIFFDKLTKHKDIEFDSVFSEEGGRFYHEQNRNVVMELSPDELLVLPEGYFWADYQTLNILIQFNNCLNIQLRNLLSLFPI